MGGGGSSRLRGLRSTGRRLQLCDSSGRLSRGGGAIAAPLSGNFKRPSFGQLGDSDWERPGSGVRAGRPPAQPESKMALAGGFPRVPSRGQRSGRLCLHVPPSLRPQGQNIRVAVFLPTGSLSGSFEATAAMVDPATDGLPDCPAPAGSCPVRHVFPQHSGGGPIQRRLTGLPGWWTRLDGHMRSRVANTVPHCVRRTPGAGWHL